MIYVSYVISQTSMIYVTVLTELILQDLYST